MEQLIRAFCIYAFVIFLFRLAGKRTLQQLTIVDFVLLLIISEATNQGMLGEDHSLINGFLVISLYVMLDVFTSMLKQRSKKFEKVMDNVPEIIVENGRMFEDKMKLARVDKDDVLEKARQLHGLVNLSQIRYAILEKNGQINIIPAEDEAGK